MDLIPALVAGFLTNNGRPVIVQPVLLGLLAVTTGLFYFLTTNQWYRHNILLLLLLRWWTIIIEH